jgi:predicted dinucleotide-binding enzyme
VKIGVIGAGMIGLTVGRLWVAAGHDVRFGSRDAEALRLRLEPEGLGASAVTIAAAATFGEVVFTAAPYGVWPALAGELQPYVASKVVMDAANPYPDRDGQFAVDALAAKHGAGRPVAALLPSAKLVRAFSTVYYKTLQTEAHRAGDPVGIPLAGDDPQALAVAERLVRDAGFEPVVVGDLDAAVAFDPGTQSYNTGASATEIRALLAL